MNAPANIISDPQIVLLMCTTPTLMICSFLSSCALDRKASVLFGN